MTKVSHSLGRTAQVLFWLSLLSWGRLPGITLSLARPVSPELAGTNASDAAFTSGTAIQTPLPEGFPPPSLTASPFPADTSPLPSAGKAAGSMLFIVGMILIVAFLLKRYLPQRFGPALSPRQIQVVETAVLGDRQSLTLVRVGEATLLLARTPGSITLLDRVELKLVNGEAAQEATAVGAPGPMPRVTSDNTILRCCKTALARLRQAKGMQMPFRWLRRKQLPLAMPALNGLRPSPTSPDFESVMRAELHNAQLLSRLSQIRSELASK